MVHDLLKTYWDIEVDRVEFLEQATASCFRVFSGEGSYFLKRFQRSFSPEKAVLDAKICKILCEHHVRASEILETVSGESFAQAHGHIWQLQRFSSGLALAQNAAEEELVCRASAYLAQIHCVLKEEKLPLLFDRAWFEKFDKEKYIAYYRETLAWVKKVKIGNVLREKIENDILFSMELTEKMPLFAECFQNVTLVSSHGDYTPSQLLCENGEIVRIVDFANVHTVPATWELMRFYYLASSDIGVCASFCMPRFQNYLRSYLRIYPLTAADLENMPYMFLYYMGRNRFLYRRFLENGDELSLRESERKMAFCRYLCNHMDTFLSDIRGLSNT